MSSLHIVLQFVFSLATLLFILRFLLQASGADFYNPISQAVTNASDPVCKPIRLILKPYRNLDFASFLAAWLVATLGVFAAVYVRANGAIAPIGPAFWQGLISMLLVLTQFYYFTLIIVIIASFLSQGSSHPALQLLQQLIEPILGPIRRIMPSLGPLDLSPMVLFLIIIVVQDLLQQSMRV